MQFLDFRGWWPKGFPKTSRAISEGFPTISRRVSEYLPQMFRRVPEGFPTVSDGFRILAEDVPKGSRRFPEGLTNWTRRVVWDFRAWVGNFRWLSQRRTVFFRSQGAYWGYFRFGGNFWCLSARGVGPTEREAFKMVPFGFWGSRGVLGDSEGFPSPSGQEELKNSDFRFWREILGTSRANFEGLRVISEWGLGSIGCEGLKNGPFRFGGFPHGNCVFPLISRKNALWAHCVDYCACVVFVCIRNEGVTVERQVGDGGAASGRRWSGK